RQIRDLKLLGFHRVASDFLRVANARLSVLRRTTENKKGRQDAGAMKQNPLLPTQHNSRNYGFVKRNRDPCKPLSKCPLFLSRLNVPGLAETVGVRAAPWVPDPAVTPVGPLARRRRRPRRARFGCGFNSKYRYYSGI